MKVAALVSGGKDSILALHTAQCTGWDVTHVVTVTPTAQDSWMFHVPNSDLGPVIAGALGLPLVRVETKGEKEAELADLEAALAKLPIDGFVSGALGSEYQRTRLEGIGHRLGLKSFAPLWHKRPEEVLTTITGAGWDVRIAAVAAEGLGEEWLGRKLTTETVAQLHRLASRYGLSPVGEGGEYESLVLDAPCYQKRIEVVRAEKTWKRDGGSWHVTQARLASKSS